MKDDYEILETFTKENETYSYLRHKKTGLEIAYHQCETEETGFSFCFKTPVEDQYLGTAHVLEHCIFQGSKKYDLSLWKLGDFSLNSGFNGYTYWRRTVFDFYSLIESEVFKMIPVFADYVFFPQLSEEAFMQECMHVEFSPDKDGRKKEVCGVVYNEMKARKDTEEFFSGGLYYKLSELTVEKIRDYHKKYYKPDNCLFAFSGKADLEKVVSEIDRIIPDLEAAFSKKEVSSRKNLTISEALKKFPLKNPPENLDTPDESDWDIDLEAPFCRQLPVYWSHNFSPLMPFILEKNYAYTINSQVKEYEEKPVPPKKSVQKIISEYLSRFTPEEYKIKMENLRKWQNRSVRELARKKMEPLAVKEYDVIFQKSEEELKAFFKRYSPLRHHEVEIKTGKNSLSILFRCSEPLSREYYAEYALIFCLSQFFHHRLRKAGVLYHIGCNFDPYNYFFSISTDSSDKPEKTLRIIEQLLRETAEYRFTESDLIAIKFIFYNIMLCRKSMEGLYFSERILDVTPLYLHKAAVRFSELLSFYLKHPHWYEPATDSQIKDFIKNFNKLHTNL